METGLKTRLLILFPCFILIYLVLHWRVFHYEIGGIHAWRQSQTAENILNFNRYDSNILNPRTNNLTRDLKPTIYRYEFPVMQWTVGMIMRVTGDRISTTRVLMFLLGLIAVLGMYYWLKQFYDNCVIAFLGAWAFSFSPVFFYYTMNPLPDNLALCSTIWFLAFFFRFVKTNSLWMATGSVLCISLAMASKLPYIVFLAAPCAWWLYSVISKRFRQIGSELKFAAIYLLIIAPALWWYAWVIPTWSNGVLAGITANKLPWDVTVYTLKYHINTMFPKMLLGYVAVIFLLQSFYFALQRNVMKDVRFWWLLAITFGVSLYFIFEFNMIGVVHDYYMMPFLPILYFMVAYGIKQCIQFKKWTMRMTLILLALMPIVTGITTWNSWSPRYIPEHSDVYLNYKELRDAAPPGSKCIILNDVSTYIFSYLVDKYAFVFNNDYLPADWVKDMILNYDVTYMYSTSRKVDEDPEVNKYLERLVMERGNVRVFLLKQLDK